MVGRHQADGLCVEIYTDGSCKGNPGPAGCGIVLKYGAAYKEISQFLGPSTNNIAELMAIKIGLAALRRHDIPVRLYTDSQYCVGVLSRQWRTKKNTQLVAEIKEMIGRFSDFLIEYVPGHKNIEANERADQLANISLKKISR